MKHFCRFLPLLVVSLFCTSSAFAQSQVDFAVGFGTAQDKSTGLGIDENAFGNYGTLLSCTPATSSACSAAAPSLGGFFLGFGGNLMLWKHLGVGAEVSLQPSQQNYVILQPTIASQGQPGYSLTSRTTFYDVNAVYQPIKTKRAALQLAGGIGGANFKLYENGNFPSSIVSSSNYSQYAGSANHFQVHAGLGVQLYVTEHIFVRPQFDLHWVNNFNQYGRNVVTEETVWLGYTFGGQ